MRPSAGVSSFRSQFVVLTVCVTAFAMLLLTVVLQLVLANVTRRNVNRVLEDRADAVVSSAQSASTGGQLVVPDSDLDVGVVVYDADGTPVAGIPSPGLRPTYDALSTTTRTRVESAGETSRIRASPFTTPEGPSGVVIVAERLAPYEKAETYALIVSLVTGALATVAAAAIAAWVTKRALQPVAVLARTAADWSEHDLGRRFGLGTPTNEITALAAILDTLLDKVSATIRAEQRLTSELAHELRTPLTAIQGTADLALMRDELSPDARDDLTQISSESRRMATTITALLELARSEASITEASSCSLAEVVAEATAAPPAGDVVMTVDVADQRLALPQAIALRAVTPVVENAMHFARAHVNIAADLTTPGVIQLSVEDDGPGVATNHQRIFEPGMTSGTGSGAGLGLAIARRMARSVGGDVELVQRGDPTRFVIRLPRA